MELTCPKCQGPMRTYERNGVHVDQCADCRGIFLDRGELERLIDAESAWHGTARATATSSPSPSSGHAGASGQPGPGSGLGAIVNEVLGQARGHRSSGSGHHYDDDRRYDQYGRPRRKKSFLDELFG